MLKLHNVSKCYGQQLAVNNVTLTVEAGEIFGLIGQSGAGKSTILRMMNCLEEPTSGDVIVGEQNLVKSTPRQLRAARKSIGMIFQHFNLVANKTVFQNVEIALVLAKYPKAQRKKRVMECLQFVGLQAFQSKYPAQLSGGQKQRVAIARALANEPAVLLCDEPTSSLDPKTTAEILHVLQEINKRLDVTIVIVSHEMDVIKRICHRVCVVSKGEVYDIVNIEPIGIAKIEDHPQTFVDELVREGL
ncbi:MAG: ATP-binding cassette domain-containing protein [Kurthia sp.]|nr:ATP-binding cassette domain-containing protein [Candidatus Kurthia equi]